MVMSSKNATAKWAFYSRTTTLQQLEAMEYNAWAGHSHSSSASASEMLN